MKTEKEIREKIAEMEKEKNTLLRSLHEISIKALKWVLDSD